MVVRGAYTISSFMEGTGTNLRLPLNPPFDAEFETLYNTPSDTYPKSALDQGLFGLNNPDPFITQPSACGIRTYGPPKCSSGILRWSISSGAATC